MIRIKDIFQALSFENSGSDSTPITEAVIDSRKTIPGSLFIALKGERVNGHRYVEKAFDQGALAAIIDQDIPDFDGQTIDTRKMSDQTFVQKLLKQPFCIRVDDSLAALQTIARFWRKKLPVRVIGITGSVGKSSTKELTADVLAEKFYTYKNPGNYNNEIGLPLTLINMGQGYEKLVLEMGFYYPGEISFLCDISLPDVGVITNIGTVHAERAGSQEAIAEGKAELITSLPAKPYGTAILNYDDPFVRPMAEKTKSDVLFYGLNNKADLWADEIKGLGLKGIQFCIHYRGKSMDMNVPLLGRHSVQTILRASAIGLTEGMTMEEIAEGLENNNSQLRLVAVRTKSGALILDDTYNATPESTIAALDLLSELTGNKIAVLGDMLELGKYEELGHQQVGEKAAVVANYLIAVGERGRIIANTARMAGMPPTAITWMKDAVEAAQFLQYNLKSSDVVLVKGSHGVRMDRISAILEASK